MCDFISVLSWLRLSDCTLSKVQQQEHSLVKCVVYVACLAGQCDRRDTNKSEEIDFRVRLCRTGVQAHLYSFPFHTQKERHNRAKQMKHFKVREHVKLKGLSDLSVNIQAWS